MSAHVRDDWYEFQLEDMDFAQSLTDDADRLYAAGATGDNALCFLAAQHDAAKFGKVFSTPVIELHSGRWSDNMGDAAFAKKARKGLPDDGPRNLLPVEILFRSSSFPDAPPVRMAGVLHIGAMLEGGK